MFKKQVYIKPLNTEGTLWGVFKMSIFESFFDDCMRHGLSVAWGNFQTQLTMLMSIEQEV